MSRRGNDSGAVGKIAVRGRFSVILTDGTDVTPVRRKERGLLSLLAMAPEKRRTRAYLRDKLWSDRGDDQATASLRRALCDLRRSIGPAGSCLKSDRSEIWLAPELEIDMRPDLEGEAEILETVDVPDPEFEDWLRDIRQGMGTVQPPFPHRLGLGITSPHLSRAIDASTLVSIIPTLPNPGPEDTYLTALLTDALSSRMIAEGNAEVHLGSEPTSQRISEAGTYLRLEITSIAKEGRWNVILRAFVDRGRRFLWSGQLTLPLDFKVICEGTDVAAFVSTALTNLLARLRQYKLAERSTYLTLQRSAHRLFTARREDVALAETELAALASTSSAAIALAWRAFALLTRALEFGEDQDALFEHARVLATEALSLAPSNPLVLALAAQVEIKLCGDLDRGRHLAEASLRACDQNPYALHAMSQAQLFEGTFGQAHETAKRARQMAEGMSNAFCWDMQVCLTAMGVEDLDASQAAARAAHACNPGYRPALRYLTALNVIQGRGHVAERYAATLAKCEPGFTISRLSRPDYPVHTLRRAGFGRDLVA